MPTIGIGVEYALHTMLYLIDPPGEGVLGLKDIAEYQGVSESYLAKIFTRLKKGGLLLSSKGVKGGYELSRSPEAITFWDVVVAVEGELSFFECKNVRSSCVLYKDMKEKPKFPTACSIHSVMMEAEQKVSEHLKTKTLAWLNQTVGKKIPREAQKQSADWFRAAMEDRA